MNEETWRVIPGWDDLYQVSSEGRVRNMGGHVLRPSTSGRTGHLRVNLHKPGEKARTINVHRLVALAFIGEPTGPLVRHLDDDPRNNTPANLAYGDKRDNYLDSLANGRNYHVRKAWRDGTCQRGHDVTDSANLIVSGGSERCRPCRNLMKRMNRRSSPHG